VTILFAGGSAAQGGNKRTAARSSQAAVLLESHIGRTHRRTSHLWRKSDPAGFSSASALANSALRR
jgi:hypothetical protein